MESRCWAIFTEEPEYLWLSGASHCRHGETPPAIVSFSALQAIVSFPFAKVLRDFDFLKTGSHHVAQTDLKPLSLLPQPPSSAEITSMSRSWSCLMCMFSFLYKSSSTVYYVHMCMCGCAWTEAMHMCMCECACPYACILRAEEDMRDQFCHTPVPMSCDHSMNL